MKESWFVHVSSVVDDGVAIGDGTKVWHFCHLSTGAQIGGDCTLGQNVFVGKNVRIGSRVKIQNNVSVFSGVELEDDVFVGPGVVFTNVKHPRAHIDQRESFVRTRVERGATIGANATIVCGVSLGEGCVIGAGSVVTKSVDPHVTVVGNPGRPLGGLVSSASPERKKEREPTVSQRVRALDPTKENLLIQLDLEATAIEVLQNGQFILGPHINRFETAFAQYVDAKHAVSVSSGSDALLMALMALGVGPGDEVLTSAFSFFATVEAILRVGATPIFSDIDPKSFNAHPELIADKLSERTKAVLFVHLFGQATDLSELNVTLQERGITLIEDCAQAFGAETPEGKLGNTDGIACFSFFPSKNLGGFGDAGMVTTNNDRIAKELLELRCHGAVKKHRHRTVGGNFRMDALHAALLGRKLTVVSQLLARRKAHGRLYCELLDEASCLDPQFQLPHPPSWGHTYNQFTIRTAHRDALQSYLVRHNIEARIHYPTPLHRQEALKSLGPWPRLPESEKASQEVLSLPLHPGLRSDEISRVAELTLHFLSKAVSS